jgi:hypothetical protein
MPTSDNARQSLAKWEEHFRWSADWTKVIGRTAVGSATVACLDMNANILKLARPYWRVMGLIP